MKKNKEKFIGEALFIRVVDRVYRLIIQEDKHREHVKKEYDCIEGSTHKYGGTIVVKEKKSYKKISIDLKTKKAIVRLPKMSFHPNLVCSFIEKAIVLLTLKKKTIFLHASAFIKDGKAHIFCGKAGAGKSTVRQLASEYHHLSDDTTIIKKEKNRYYVYPSPFDKRSGNVSQRRMPLGKIFFLKQDSQTRLRSLSPDVLVYKLLHSNLLSHAGYKKYKDLFCRFNLNLVKKIPIYQLRFTKSREFLRLI